MLIKQLVIVWASLDTNLTHPHIDTYLDSTQLQTQITVKKNYLLPTDCFQIQA